MWGEKQVCSAYSMYVYCGLASATTVLIGIVFVLFQKQTKEIKEKQTSVMAELAKVEPAVQDAKMGEFFRA